jgi:hypothetical protein
MRASICVLADNPEEGTAFEQWLEEWKDKMSYVSDDFGCGCCVHLYDVEGPEDGVRAIPQSIRCQSEWSESAG